MIELTNLVSKQGRAGETIALLRRAQLSLRELRARSPGMADYQLASVDVQSNPAAALGRAARPTLRRSRGTAQRGVGAPRRTGKRGGTYLLWTNAG
jgi:hypothetical protein